MSPILLVFHTKDKLFKKQEYKAIKYKKRQIYKRNYSAYIWANNLLKIRGEIEEKGMCVETR